MKVNLSFWLFILFCLASVSFFLSARIYSPLLVLTLVVWLLNAKTNFAHVKDTGILRILAMISAMFIVLVIGMAITDSWTEGLKELETSSSLLVLPWLILVSELSRRQISRIMIFFSYSVLLICIYCFGAAIHAAFVRGHGVAEFFSSYHYQTTYFSAPVGLHPSYFSMFISMAIGIVILENGFVAKSIKIPMIIVLVVANLFLLSRGGLLGMVLSFFAIAILILVSQKRFGLLASLFFLLVISSYALMQFIPGFSIRFKDSLVKIPELWNETNPSNSTGYHFKSWQCAMESFEKHPGSLIAGFGTGDEVPTLVSCYEEKGIAEMVQKKYNSHSAFLSVLMKTGIVGLLICVMNLVYSLATSIRHRDQLFLAFIIIFTTVSMFESTLNVYRGVVFFALFNALLLKRNLLPEEDHSF